MQIAQAISIVKDRLTYAGLNSLPSDDTIKFEVESAANWINYRRNSTLKATTSDAIPPEYNNVMIEMVISKIMKYGAEGAMSVSENGLSRSYKTDSGYPIDLLQSVPWAVR